MKGRVGGTSAQRHVLMRGGGNGAGKGGETVFVSPKQGEQLRCSLSLWASAPGLQIAADSSFSKAK